MSLGLKIQSSSRKRSNNDKILLNFRRYNGDKTLVGVALTSMEAIQNLNIVCRIEQNQTTTIRAAEM